MSRLAFTLCCLVYPLLFWASVAQANDWPTFRHDQQRSGVTDEQLDATQLELRWKWQSPLPPAPAWPDSARWDAYAQLDGLRSMRDYDPVFHPVIVGGQLFFGSNADDTLRCIALDSGQTIWQFTADAPIRVAPTIRKERVYFGCDDGQVYCLDRSSGSLLWCQRIGPDERGFINDGRLCCFYPVRSGVLIDDRSGDLLVSCGIFPWKSTFMAALSAETGEELWTKDLGTGWTLEGPMLLGESHIVAPQGRSAPQLFSRSDGKSVGSVAGGGGSFVLLTDDGQLLHGPGNKSGWITASNTANREKIASFEGGTAVVVRGNTTYLLTPQSLTALARDSGEIQWKTRLRCPHDLILAGDSLFVGGDDQVASVAATTGELLWAAEVQGRAMGLAAADGCLVVSTDRGEISVFSAEGRADRTDPNLSHRWIERLGYATPSMAGHDEPDTSALERELQMLRGEDSSGKGDSGPNSNWQLARGPEIRFIEPHVAEVRWQTLEPTNCQIELLVGEAAAKTEQSGDSRQHVWQLSGVDRNELVLFRILEQGSNRTSKVYECDGHFDYSRLKNPQPPTSPWQATIEGALVLSGVKQQRGIAIVYDPADDGQLAAALCGTSQLDVINIATDSDRVADIREHLLQLGVYGRPACTLAPEAIRTIPSSIANLIIVAQAPDQEQDYRMLESLLRLLKPAAHIALPTSMLDSSQAVSYGLAAEENSAGDLSTAELPEGYRIWRSARKQGAAGWTHMYGLPDNTAYAGETLGEADQTEDLEVAWCGRPGPRYQSDRGNRKPSPLASGGRLFLQGLHRLIGMDAHNGTILWSWELPEVVRFNVPRDCSNWCSDESNLYLAYGDGCQLIDGATGEFTARYPIWNPTDRPMQWGYIARHKELLLGSCVQQGTTFTEFWGKESWYDSKDGEAAKKVSSDGLFALDAETGALIWNYQSGLIVNPTIAIGSGKIIFNECRSEKLLNAPERRLDGAELWENLFVVALDAQTGEKLWEVPAKPMPGVSACYGVCAGDRYLLQTSDSGNFAVYAIDLSSGKGLWRGKYDWEADHHGKHLSRPAVVDGKIFLRPLTLDLENGEVLADTFPVGHQCGTYTASKNAMFLRAGSLTMWDRKSGAATRWNRVRPDCWISTIPAEGMLLSPEGGGGCSCGGWIETSMAFAPTQEP